MHRSLIAAAFATTFLFTRAAFAQGPAAGPPPVNPTAAAPPSAAPGPNPDPWEGANRKIFGVYEAVDRTALRPAAIGYKRITPRPIRTGLHNVIANLHEPVVFLNDVLQVRPKDAGTTLGRFVVNSTVGLAGLVDVATGAGLPYHDNGFGTTLGRYGTPPGPYVFLIGPSDVRDLFGSGIDILTDPLTWIRFTARTGIEVSRGVIGTLDTRANADQELKQINSMATDRYATLRSLYLQNRQAEISGGKLNLNALPSFDDTGAGPPNATGAPGTAPAPPGPPASGGNAAPLPSQSAPTAATPPPPQP